MGEEGMTITVEDLKPEERTKVECWTRIMGYYRPMEYANTGKQGEFAERVYFKEPSHVQETES